MQELQKQPQWFACECPCTKGKLILHTFKCMGFVTYPDVILGDVSILVQYMNFEITCQKCMVTSERHIKVEDINYFLDRLTPNVTHDDILRNQIVWYWDNQIGGSIGKSRKPSSVS